MTVNMRDIADVLRAAGVPVVEEGNWQDRGTGGSFDAVSIMLHHDASPEGETSSSADYIIDNLLAQVWLDYDGAWHICAAGRMNHAGKGSWPGVPTDNANATFIGLETDHTTNEHWTSGQRQYGLRGILALADWLGIRDSADDLYRHLIAHKEWAPTRKVDPDPLDMDDLRALILNPPTMEGPVQTHQRRSDEHTDVTDAGWTALPFDDNGVTNLLTGPAEWFSATVQVYVTGVPGTKLSLRPYRKHDDGSDSDLYTIRDYVLDAQGSARCDLAQQGNLPAGQRLRISAHAVGAHDLTVTATRGQVAAW